MSLEAHHKVSSDRSASRARGTRAKGKGWGRRARNCCNARAIRDISANIRKYPVYRRERGEGLPEP
eukprot:9117237-Pyramimonas_sp.AAC.1